MLSVLLSLPLVSGCGQKPLGRSALAAGSQQITTAEKISLPGCGNMYKVSGSLYRGSQPTPEGFRQLEKMGIQTILNLRAGHSDLDKLKGTSLRYKHIDMEPSKPRLDQVDAFLKIVTDPAAQPVFVHCLHGADRTGAMVAVYRTVLEGWDKERAIAEMRYGPFGFHELLYYNLAEFVNDLDTDQLKACYNPQQFAQTSH